MTAYLIAFLIYPFQRNSNYYLSNTSPGPCRVLFEMSVLILQLCSARRTSSFRGCVAVKPDPSSSLPKGGRGFRSCI